MFKHLFKARPVSSNSSPRSRRDFKRKIEHELVGLVERPLFPADSRLKATVYYFNHDRSGRTRDIHNILKPLFDNLEGIVYDNDAQIIRFEAFRLDMFEWGETFHIENRKLSDEQIGHITDSGMTSLFVEIQAILTQVESGVGIIWLPQRNHRIDVHSETEL